MILDQAEEYFTYHGDAGGFERALAELVNRPLRVNVLLSLREDTLARLDRLKGAIPNLFANVLRLDRLDRAAGRAAILRPLERWGELEGEDVVAEDVLVERVLDGVGAGRIELGPGGLGAVEPNGSPRGIEAPYLQLVMQRLWDVERGAGSTTLRAETLDALGGAGQIVADHLERAIDALTPEQREIAARLFDHLVTPSGMKIAHEASDLARVRRRAGGARSGPSSRRSRTTASCAPTRAAAGRSSTTCSPAPCSAGRPVTTRSGRSPARARSRGDGIAGSASSRSARSSALRWRPRSRSSRLAQRSDAREQAQVATSGQLAASALSLIDSDPELGLALALEAARVDPNPRAEDALRRTLAASRERAIYDVGHPLVSLDLDRSGTKALVVGRRSRCPADRPSRRRRAVGAPGRRRRSRVRSRRAHRACRPPTVAAALDARTGRPLGDPVRLVAAGQRRDARPEPRRSHRRSSSPASPAPASSTSRQGLRSAASSSRRASPTRRTRRRVASSRAPGVDRSARLWDSRTWTETRALRGPCRPGHRRCVRPDERPRRNRQHGSDGADLAWPNRRARRLPCTGTRATSRTSRSVPAGLVVTASGDETARTWAADGRPIQELRGHTGSVVAAEFAGRDVVVTAGADGTIRTWDPGTSVELGAARVEAPPPPSKRATGAGGAEAEAIKAVIRLRTPAGERDAPRPRGSRQHRRVQPGRATPRVRGPRPRRHRLGRRERRDRASLLRGAVGIRRRTLASARTGGGS